MASLYVQLVSVKNMAKLFLPFLSRAYLEKDGSIQVNIRRYFQESYLMLQLALCWFYPLVCPLEMLVSANK